MMLMRRIILLSLLPAILMLFSGCEELPKGACVTGSGYSARCRNDDTHAQCNMYNGDEWYEGTSCEELGFGKNAAQTLVISEVYFNNTTLEAGNGWVELLNASGAPVDLTGFQLVHQEAGGGVTTIKLNGVIDACGTFVVGGPVSNSSNGYPVFDHVGDLSKFGQSSALIALLLPGDRLVRDCALSVVTLGSKGSEQMLDDNCHPYSIHTGDFVGSISFKLLDWPANKWKSGGVADPHFVTSVLGCNSGSGTISSWSMIQGAY